MKRGKFFFVCVCVMDYCCLDLMSLENEIQWGFKGPIINTEYVKRKAKQSYVKRI